MMSGAKEGFVRVGGDENDCRAERESEMMRNDPVVKLFLI